MKRRANLTKAQIRDRSNQAECGSANFTRILAPSRQILNSETKKKEQINEPKFTKRPSLLARISRTSDVLAAT